VFESGRSGNLDIWAMEIEKDGSKKFARLQSR
jgi:hypothetical protein